MSNLGLGIGSKVGPNTGLPTTKRKNKLAKAIKRRRIPKKYTVK